MVPPAVDREAVMKHWSTLSPQEKLHTLRFEDSALVERLFNIQHMLCEAELLCLGCGVRSDDMMALSLMSAGMHSFTFECKMTSTGDVRPVAFFARRAFAESRNLFDHLDQELGGFLQDVRPSSRRIELLTLFERMPNSWLDFSRQVLRLVEIALLRSQQDAVAAGQELINEEAAVAPRPAAAAPRAEAKRSSKRKARKGRGAASRASEQECSQALSETSTASCDGDSIGRPDCASEQSISSEASVEEGEAGGVEEPLVQGTTAAGQERAAVIAPSLRPGAWAAWLHNSLPGDAAEWRWGGAPAAGPHAASKQDIPAESRAVVVKNTFLDVEPETPSEAAAESRRRLHRARTLPVPRSS